MVEVLSYSIVIVIILIGLFLIKYCKVPIMSLTGVSFIVYALLILLPSAPISQGYLPGVFSIFSSGPKPLVFVIAVCGYVFLLLAVLSSKLICSGFQIEVRPRRYFSGWKEHLIYLLLITSILLSFVLGFCSDFPIWRVMTGKSLLFELSNRTEYRNSFPVDILFGVTLPFIWFFIYSKYKSCNSRSGRAYVFYLLVFFVAIMFFKLARLGRDDLFPFLIGILCFSFFGRGVPLGRVAVSFVGLVITWFALTPSSIPFDIVASGLFDRVIMQTSFVYFHLDYVPFFGLWSNGAQTWWADSEVLNPSVEVFSDLYGRDGGSTAGYAFARLWYVFGPFAIGPFFLGLVFLFSVDMLLMNSLRMKTNNSWVARGLYASFFCTYVVATSFNLTSVFSYGLGFSSLSFLIFSILFFIYKIRLVRFL